MNSESNKPEKCESPEDSYGMKKQTLEKAKDQKSQSQFVRSYEENKQKYE